MQPYGSAYILKPYFTRSLVAKAARTIFNDLLIHDYCNNFLGDFLPEKTSKFKLSICHNLIYPTTLA